MRGDVVGSLAPVNYTPTPAQEGTIAKGKKGLSNQGDHVEAGQHS